MTTAEKTAAKESLIQSLPCKVAAVVRSTDDKHRFVPTAHAPRSFAFSEYCVQEALADAKLLSTLEGGGVSVQVRDPQRLGVNLGVGIVSLDDVADVALALHRDPQHPQYSKIHPLFVPKILGNMLSGVTAMKYDAEGPIGSAVAACATGAYCIGEAATWIQREKADVVICGAAESCINGIAIGGFSRMRALCTRYNDTPECASRPFDKESGGFVMGEGGGVLILEEYEHARQRGATIYAELRGFGQSSDAHHVAAPHPEGRGAAACIRGALADSGGVTPADVGYVNAHATGTIGDTIELSAIEKTLLQSSRPSPLLVSSSKGALGHLLRRRWQCGGGGSGASPAEEGGPTHREPPAALLDYRGADPERDRSGAAWGDPCAGDRGGPVN
ncbi:Beta-ketoacyl synthase, N-terminal domain/Beta-ketoacyl synthase, C-terminal domain containing protein, putative [Angomonas deanei]|uniref:beta-ketoacyl-[acyl-carrier-protein] synthase I n=1 Tax=Angomonas deanei TaxID=59799 RepID=A0A7G2CPM0_9TRYP|nr:Beta-ketoacyl synthase, N-terminal domain/Beta-ketoacyl synthase, C-terminal domain containing protein, putative [Angomonas deanei]